MGELRVVAAAAAALIAFGAFTGATGAATGSGGNDSVTIVEIGGGGTPFSTRVAELKVTGNVTVDFHGDPAAGCEAAGNCDVSGVVVWTPSQSGILTAVQYVEHRRRHTTGYLALGLFASPASGAVASVKRGGSASCSDVATGGGDVSLADRVGRSVQFALASDGLSDPFDTRCAGPLAQDVRSALPTPTLPFRAIRRSARVQFSGVGAFSAHGLSGSVRSALQLRVTRVQRQTSSGAPPAQPRPVPGLRVMFSTYRIDQVSGQLPIDFAGLPSPAACAALDSCGVTGTMALDPHNATGVMTIAAIGPSRRPDRDFLTALGLARGGRTSGLSVDGSGFFGGQGTTTTEVVRPGAPSCRDTSALRSGLIEARPGPRAVRFSYDSLAFIGVPRTRCGGPLFESRYEPLRLALGTVPPSALKQRLAAVHLRTGTALTERGYSIRTRPDLAIAFEPLGVRSYTFPGGF